MSEVQQIDNIPKPKESKLANSCEMEDLVIYPYGVVSQNFQSFIQKTSHIYETKEILSKVCQSLRLKYDSWPTSEDAQSLFEQSISNAKRRSVKWSESDKKLFYWIVIRYYLSKEIYDSRQLSPDEWREIAKLVLGRNAHQCRLKWEQKYKISLSDVPWTEEEDQLLQSVHEEFSRLGKENKWSQIAREIYKRSPNKVFRQPKQCRERWINKLDPNISKQKKFICSDPWSKQQEIDLLKMILIRGKKWSELSALYGRVRTENALKNKYNSLLKKEKLKYEFETINPHLFTKVQKLRQDYSNRYGNITPIEEIDNYEWQFIVLAIQSLYIDLCIQEGKYVEAEKIKNDDFFDLFQNETLELDVKQNLLYKKTLNIKRVDTLFNVENDRSGIVIFNGKTKKLFITPYNTLDFYSIVLKQFLKPLKVEEQFKQMESNTQKYSMEYNQLQQSFDELNRKSAQPLYFYPNQASYILPMGQSVLNSYWLPPVLPQQISQSMGLGHSQKFNNQQNYNQDPQPNKAISFQQSQEKISNPQQQISTKEGFDDLFGQIDIKVVDSDQEQ